MEYDRGDHISSSNSISKEQSTNKFQGENDDNDDELINMSNFRLEFFNDSPEENGCATCRSSSKPTLLTSMSSSSIPVNLGIFRTLRTNSNGSATFELPNSYSLNNDLDIPLLQDGEDIASHQQDDEDHCHVWRKHFKNHRARNQLLISGCLCLLFMIAEFIGGYLSNSLAVMTDAAHLLSDLGSFLISLFAIWIGNRPPSQRMSFGYHRAEILGALISVLIIWILTGVLVYVAIKRIIDQDYSIDADIMIIIAGVGVGMNILMGFVLNNICHCHTHSHGLSHDHAHSHTSQQNINVRAAFIHVVGDLIQSIGVLIAAFIIKFKPEYHLADPICTFLFSALVLFTTTTIIRDAVHILMEGFPKNISYKIIKHELQNIEGVKMAHSLHIWSLTIEKPALVVHLAVEPNVNNHQIVKNANRLIREKYNIYHSTIQTEPYDPLVMTQCSQCIGP